MIRKFAVSLVVLMLPPVMFAEPSLLLVEMVDSDMTDYSSCTEDDCIPHDFWWVHTARVKKTIAGSFNRKEIRFVRLQHTQYVERIREHLFVLIDETENAEFDELFGTRLVARDTAYPVSLVCFDADLASEFPDVERFEYEEGEFKAESCFNQDVLENGWEPE